MNYLLELSDTSGKVQGIYNNITNSISIDGIPSVKIKEKKQGNNRFSIRISLGAACNYSCIYCSEHDMKNYNIHPILDVKKYVSAIFDYVKEFYNTNDDTRYDISFWGGEALVYFGVVKAIHQEFINSYPSIKMSFGLCTNGELLKGDIAKYLLDNKIGITISWDGPGQIARNANDILAVGTEQYEFYLANNKKISFSSVIHKYNPNLREFYNYCLDRFKTDYVQIADVQCVRMYSDNSYNCALTDNQLYNFVKEATEYVYNNEYSGVTSFFNRHGNNIVNQLNRSEAYLNCISQDQTRNINIDLNGDSWACHNNVGQRLDENGDNFYRGNIYKKTHTPILFTRHKQKLETQCKDCLFLHMCPDNCPMIPTKYYADNCKIAWHTNYPYFATALHQITGRQLTSIEPIKE